MRRGATWVMAGVAALGLGACEPSKPAATGGAPATAFKSIDITGAEYAKGFTLPDVDGKTRTLTEFKGKVVAVFFGYAQCPDVCPTTMAELAQIKRQLGEPGRNLEAVFITLDPERDTAPVLKAYVANFDPSFVALRGSADDTKAVAQSYKVFFSRSQGKTAGSYTIDHTAGLYIYDREGRLRLFSRHGAKTEDLTADLQRLLS